VLIGGDSEIDTVYRIFRMCGTPTEKTWPGCSSLPTWTKAYPEWVPGRTNEYLTERCPKASEVLKDLLIQCFSVRPEGRIPMANMLKHVK
jgi:hypothetical protein